MNEEQLNIVLGILQDIVAGKGVSYIDTIKALKYVRDAINIAKRDEYLSINELG